MGPFKSFFRRADEESDSERESELDDGLDLSVFEDSPPRDGSSSAASPMLHVGEDEDGMSMEGEDGGSQCAADVEESPLLLIDERTVDGDDELEPDGEPSESESEPPPADPTGARRKTRARDHQPAADDPVQTTAGPAGFHASVGVPSAAAVSLTSRADQATAGAEAQQEQAVAAPPPASRRKVKVMKSSLPLMLGSKNMLKKAQESHVLVQLGDPKFRQVETATGAIGRFHVTEQDDGHDKDEMMMILDLAGTESWADFARTPSLLIVDVGREAATVECVFQSMLELRTRRDHLSFLNPFTTGAHDFELQETDEERTGGDESNSTDTELESGAPAARKSKLKKRKTSKGQGKAQRSKSSTKKQGARSRARA